MPRIMFDTNVYCDGSYHPLVSKIRSVVVSSVVVQELLVIADGPGQTALIRDFHQRIRNGSAFVPEGSDWIEAGKCLGRLLRGRVPDSAKLAKDEVHMLVRDALIARTAIRARAILVTSNTSDFSKIKSVFASLKFKSPTEFFGR